MLRVRAVADALGVSVPTVWRWASVGSLPRPVKLSMRVSAWRVATIEAFIKQREEMAVQESADEVPA